MLYMQLYILEGHHFAHNDPHRYGLRLGTGERDDQDRRGPKIKVARWITRCRLPQCFVVNRLVYIPSNQQQFNIEINHVQWVVKAVLNGHVQWQCEITTGHGTC